MKVRLPLKVVEQSMQVKLVDLHARGECAPEGGAARMAYGARP